LIEKGHQISLSSDKSSKQGYTFVYIQRTYGHKKGKY